MSIGYAVLLLAGLGQVAATPAPSPTIVSPEYQPAELDRLVAADDYRELGRRLSSVSRPADARSNLDWLRARVVQGGSTILTIHYLGLLWATADLLPPPHQREQRKTAVLMSLHALATIDIDGSRCRDGSAPTGHAQRLTVTSARLWPFMASLTAAERSELVDLAVQLERHTASPRDQADNADFLCRGGLEEMSHALAHGTSREGPANPSVPGRQILLDAGPDYRPALLPREQWVERAAARRASLRQNLERYLASADRVAPPAARSVAAAPAPVSR